MNRNNLGKFIVVILVIAWAFYEMYPPTSRNLATEFETKAVAQRRDAEFTNIVTHLQKLQQANPERAYANLIDAIGTNDIARYFPMYDVKAEANPNRAVLNRLQRDAAGKIRLGLDLQGGTSFLVGVDYSKTLSGTNAAATNNAALDTQKAGMLSQAVEVLRKRVDKFGVSEPVIQPEGEDRILIQLPGLSESDKEDARRQLSKPAYLEFRLVHEHSDEFIRQGLTEPGYEVLTERDEDANGKVQTRSYLVKKKPELTGKYISGAMVGRNNVGQPEIDFTLTSDGADIFATVTRENVGRQLAVVLDGELQTAPVIHGEIPGGHGQITGTYTDKRAQEIANVLENPLQVPVHILSESSVDPTLGKDTVKSGVKAAIIGTIAVAGFMVIYYMFAGAIADVALISNIIILIGVMASIGTTLTLPGIAGIVLTIGMAVDANVLIFERIREESAKGKSLRGALSAGYDRAFGTIFDSHVTTLISSIILIFMGSGPIKGFGVTLTIGVAASLFTALVVTRIIFDFLISREIVKSLPMLHIIRVTKIDFMKVATPAFICTWLLIVVGLGFGVYRGTVKHDLFGVDFAGGDNLMVGFSQKVDADKIREAVARDAGEKEAIIQYQKDISSSVETLSIKSPYGTSDKILQVLQKDFPAAQFVSKGAEKVGPIIGKEIQQTAIVASLLSLLGILVYVAFRYEFSFAVGAVAAVIHDVLMTIGIYCLFGRQFNATMVAAVLTIIGFSINDTIVIFDRIREDLKLGVRGSFKDLINQALNQTLSRTIITSGTVFLATLSLYLFGGGAINDFAFTFLVGIITGTYSSIYIASYLVLKWHKGARPQTSSQVTVQNAATSRT
ncbi:protein translocase subunit SecDF [Pedosphaera parvula]|uniref:Multifunctional fusion protein n=1 Tax=Pedosphaera parvula (strain Ellin514) TaxID=320771 RepID=B9XN52_PEDPL|nr:protein translocase subunit SecDF [Pedosphaera parvula]EEF58714.1 protein-export membrane protein SecD [Pedosphaera parvula Ellin514]